MQRRPGGRSASPNTGGTSKGVLKGRRGGRKKRIDVFRTGNVEAFDEFRERLTPWLSGLPRPCGLLAANDTTADVVLRVLRGLRIKVPEDIAVVGIDNDPLICENTTPTLTSVAPDFESSGYIAAEMLDAKMAGRCAGDEIRTFGALHVVRRGSTRRSLA